ncbi:hypothetical protein ANANG_G00227620 [Anguilla anguilla]|uniref:Uncharacterized protein n=1 Tax=Anguilla anguilla TaxID=7936 RepID=A0A9D3LXC6_ANGAN|nr:hypothetical protein ANANG_G00227620 [Anguilla anguilla]
MDFLGIKCYFFLFVFINSVFISEQTKEEVLLDMRAARGELGWLTSPYNDGWEITQRVVNGSQLYTYSVCKMGFVVRDCGSFDGASLTCKETFNLHYAEADADVGTSFHKTQFRKVATIAPDEVTADAELRVNAETRTVGPLAQKGFYLAFQDIGACVALLSVRVYYKDRPRIYCTVDGEWVVPVGQCQCKPGFEAVGDACQECQPGFFKESVSTEPCQACPENTEQSAPGALSCQCKTGFYRAPEDPQTAACSAPPSAPLNLVAITTQASAGRLQLSWSPPSDAGGRGDITYSVACERCEWAVCLPCGDKVRFEPGPSGLLHPRVGVSELEPLLNYTFTVEAHNGVSQFSARRRSALHYTASVSVHHSLTLHRSPQGDVHACGQAGIHQPGAVLDRIPEGFATKHALRAHVSQEGEGQREGNHHVHGAGPGQELGPDHGPGAGHRLPVPGSGPEPRGGGGTYSEEFRFETLEVEDTPQGNTAVIVGAAAGGGAMLFLVVVVLLIRKRRRNPTARQGPEDTYFSSSEQLKPLKTYVDPHTYEDPNMAVLKFASEIHPSHIAKQKVIGAGEFGEVFRGVLKAPGARRWRWPSRR